MSSPSWADVVEHAHLVKKIQKAEKLKRKKKKQNGKKKIKPEDHIGRMVFVGNLDFSDLECGKMFKFRDIISERRAQFLSMCEKFGKIHNIETHWKKKFLFVTYEDAESAKTLVDSLASFEQRLQYCKETKVYLKSIGVTTKAAPKPNFYVRWPKKHKDPSDPKIPLLLSSLETSSVSKEEEPSALNNKHLAITTDTQHALLPSTSAV
jgi:hypothetical protein